MIDQLYTEYGKWVIQLEICQGKVNLLKEKIAQELNSQRKGKDERSGKKDTKQAPLGHTVPGSGNDGKD